MDLRLVFAGLRLGFANELRLGFANDLRLGFARGLRFGFANGPSARLRK